MKGIILILSILLSASCTSMTTSDPVATNGNKLKEDKPNEAELEHLNKTVALAKKTKDYRLWVTSGRSINVPGVKASDYQTVIELCGKKYHSAVGDVLTSEEQRRERKKIVSYMRQYNEQMLVICQDNIAK